MSAFSSIVEASPVKRGRLSVNLSANLINLLVSTAVGLLYVPFLVRSLGPAAYGLVPLASVITSYMGIITLGLNSAVGRSITVTLEKGDDYRANLIFNTSLWGSVALTFVLLALTAFGLFFLDRLVEIPAGARHEATILFGCVAAAFLLNQIKTPFEVCTFCRNRFDLRNLIDLAELLVRVGVAMGLIVLVIPNVSFVGMGILSGTVISFWGTVILWRRLTPVLQIRPTAFDWTVLKELAHTGTWVVVNHLGALLYLGIDLIVANRIFGPETSGRYAAVLQLAIFIRSIGTSIGPVFAPTSLFYYAKNDVMGLVDFMKRAMKLMGLLLALPISLTCGFAEPLLRLWLGPSFESLGPLLVLMVIHLSVNLAINPLLGLQLTANRVKVPGVVTLVMGFGNFGLALFLARYWGLYGIAAAGGIMLTAKNLFFTPVYAARILNRPARTFLLPLAAPVATTLVMIALCRLVTAWTPIENWFQLAAGASGVAVFYAIVGYRVLINEQERSALLQLVHRVKI